MIVCITTELKGSDKLTIFDKDRMRGRTVIQQIINLFNMGSELEARTDDKQDRLIAGKNIVIKDNVISASGKIDPAVIDDELSDESEDAVQNKVIKAGIDNGDNQVRADAYNYTDTAIDNITQYVDDEIVTVEGIIGSTRLALEEQIEEKQDTLVSGTNIKTINGTSVLGSGNIAISSGGSNNAYLRCSNYSGTVITKEEMAQAYRDCGFDKADFNASYVLDIVADISDPASLTKLKSAVGYSGTLTGATITGVMEHATHFAGGVDTTWKCGNQTYMSVLLRGSGGSYKGANLVCGNIGWGLYSGGIIMTGYGIDTDQVDDLVILYDSNSTKGYLKINNIAIIQPKTIPTS